MDTIARLAADPAAWAALATLIAMEVVLGVDNLVFIALLSNRVERAGGRSRAASASGSRSSSAWRCWPRAAAIVHLTGPLTTVLGHAFSVRDLLLLAGGLFLVWKATTRDSREGRSGRGGRGRGARRPARRRLGVRPDRPHRHRLFDRQHHHRGRHDRASFRSW